MSARADIRATARPRTLPSQVSRLCVFHLGDCSCPYVAWLRTLIFASRSNSSGIDPTAE